MRLVVGTVIGVVMTVEMIREIELVVGIVIVFSSDRNRNGGGNGNGSRKLRLLEKKLVSFGRLPAP